MNILIFAPYAGSNDHGMILRNYILAQGFIQQNHKVTVVASSFSHTRIKQPIVKKRVTKEFIDGIEYIWLKGPSYKQAGVFGRVASMVLYTLQSWTLNAYFNQRYDIVISSSPHPFSIYPAKYFAKKFSSKLIYDIRDLWPLTLICLGGYSSYHPFIRLMQKAEDYACKYADLVISVPRHSLDYLQKRGLDAKRFMHIGNGILDEYVDQLPCPLPTEYTDALTQIKKRKPFLICYSGALGLANALHIPIKALKYLPLHVELLIIGAGALEIDLQNLAKESGLTNRVHFFKPVSKKQVASFLKYTDITYIGLQSHEVYAYGASPTKLNDYLLAAKPILYAVGDKGNIVEEKGLGISCRAENIEDVVLAIKKFLSMSAEQLLAMGQAGRDWCIENQRVSNQIKNIMSALECS